MIAARERPHAVLIVNPNAGRLSERGREEVVYELRARFDLEAYATTARDSGIALAARAASEGARLVIAFGGDGHVNEVANGLAGTDSTLAVVPGGTMNVFARALGLPLEPKDAIEALVASLDREPKTVPLGKMDDRYFTFSAGCGFDAEAAERVERYVPAKRRFGEMFFYWSAFRVLSGSYRHRTPSMRLRGSFGEMEVAMAIACNAGPYAFFAGRPIVLAPRVRLEGGLDVFALKKMRVEALPTYVWRVLGSGALADHRDAFYEHDVDGFEILAEEKPFYRHVDGEPLPPAHSARFTLVRDILKVQV
jgi:diacylglycerol kinase family enzyme